MAVIHIDARSITEQPSGIGRYARSLIDAVVEQATDHEFVVLRHRSNQKPLFDPMPPSVTEVPVATPIDGLQNFAVGHRALEAAFARGGTPDLYHSLFHVVPAKIRDVLGDTPVVTTLHDFVWLDHPDASQPDWLTARTIQAFARMAIPRTLRVSDRVIAISEPTRRRALDFVDDDRISVISHGVDERFFEPVADPEGEFARLADPNRPTIAAIGNHKRYKNLQVLIDAFARLIEAGTAAQLVLIGDCERLAGHIDATTASEWISVPGVVGDEMLRRMVGCASVFVFPSKVEGFGLPLLEAMAMGVPTVVSDREPMRSIAADAALWFDPDAPQTLARILRRLIENETLAARMARRATRRAGQFRWEKTASRTIRVYEQLLDERA